MCGRFTSFLSPEIIAASFDVQQPFSVEPRYNIAPTQMVPVVRCHEDGRNRLDLLKWGLIPPWAKDPGIGSHMINARSESAHEKPAFRHAIKYHRCIVPASGFYEWKLEEKHKQPYYVYASNDSPLGLAGLWERWCGTDGMELETFCILTTSANSLMETIHDRMPVILSPDAYPLWLRRNMHDPQQLEELFRPYPTALLKAHKVSDRLNNPRYDSADCIERKN